MTSLAEAYEQRAGEVSRRRLYLGTGVFVAGALMVVLAIVAAATTLPTDLGLTQTVYGARELAGILAGLGLPAVFVGIFAVLPASGNLRAAAVIGAAVAVLGVVLFREAYPYEWYVSEGVPTTQTLLVATIYFFGVLTTFWCLFTAVATFKRRNDPGGTVTLTYTEGGVRKTVRVVAEDAADARAAMGGVGVFGGVDDPDRQPGVSSPGDAGNSSAPRDGGGGTVSDGGSTTANDDGEVLGADPASQHVDQYCGNCSHFDYVRGENGIQRYCGYHDVIMDDMDPCDQWTPNN